jgi:hypothetical protein
MLCMTVAAREARLRRLARKSDLRLVRSRSRNPDLPQYGGYGLVDPFRNAWVYGSHPHAFSATLEDVEAWLSTD